MTRIIILAAGKGTRMNSELPKVLVPVNGRPMIQYLMDSVIASGVDSCPIVVVSPDNKKIISEFLKGYKVEYAVQDKQLGTGHAVACTRNHLDETVDNIIVLGGDQPFLKPESIKRFNQLKHKALTVVSTLLGNFDGWHSNFYHLGRIIRGANDQVEKIIEFKDASDEEKLVTEINTIVMCFNRDWLFKNVDNLNNNNNQHEYYLTSLVNIAFKEGYEVKAINIDPHEAIGLNTQDELNIAEGLL